MGDEFFCLTYLILLGGAVGKPRAEQVRLATLTVLIAREENQ